MFSFWSRSCANMHSRYNKAVQIHVKELVWVMILRFRKQVGDVWSLMMSLKEIWHQWRRRKVEKERWQQISEILLHPSNVRNPLPTSVVLSTRSPLTAPNGNSRREAIDIILLVNHSDAVDAQLIYWGNGRKTIDVDIGWRSTDGHNLGLAVSCTHSILGVVLVL